MITADKVSLTKREQSIYDLLLQGKSVYEIGTLLELGPATLNQTTARMITKLLESMPHLQWQHCVVLCHAAPSASLDLPIIPNEFSTKAELESIALQDFLTSKDSELLQLEVLHHNLTTRTKFKTASVANA